MSRSRKKSPYYSANAGSMNSWKRIFNRRYRAICKDLIDKRDWDIIPKMNRVTSIYDTPKDCMGARLVRNFCRCILKSEKGFYDSSGQWKYYYELDENGHTIYCQSKFNPLTKKVFRK